MAILLYHENTDHGQVALSEGRVAGEHTPARHYHHQGHFLEVGGADHVVQHDVAEICRIPGYRLATPEEADRYHAGRKKAGSLHEQANDSAEERPADKDKESKKGGERK